MLDQETIIDLINTSLPIVASSPVIIKLIKSVEKIIKTLYMPVLTLRNGKAEVDVEIYRNQNLPNNQSFTLYEITKLKNFINSARYAEEELRNNAEASSEDIDFDWLMRFFDAVSCISNEEMQALWGKVLAGEIKSPGNCSLRTLEIVRNMSSIEAGIFNKLCKYVVNSGDCYFIFDFGFSELNEFNQRSSTYIETSGLKYSESIIPMIECNLLSVDNRLATDFKTDRVLSIQNDQVICLVINNEEENFISFEPYFLTKSGVELYNIISSMPEFRSSYTYPVLCFKELKEMYASSGLSITAHKIIGDNDFDESDLL